MVYSRLLLSLFQDPKFSQVAYIHTCCDCADVGYWCRKYSIHMFLKIKLSTCLLTHSSFTDPRYNFAMPTYQCVVGAFQPDAPITARRLQMHSRLGQVLLRKCNPDNCYRYFDIAVTSSVHHNAAASQGTKVGSCWYFLRWTFVSRQ